jgi:hypothetical protein
MVNDVPAPAAVPACRPEELAGIPITRRTLLMLDHRELDKSTELADWINPMELDAPAAHVLADSTADDTARHRAAAELLMAPAYLIYRVDMVAAPMAMGVRDLKIGTIGGRLIRYDKGGIPTCVVLFTFQDDKDKSDQAIARSRAAAVVDPTVAKAMRDDLKEQYLKHAPRPVGAAHE